MHSLTDYDISDISSPYVFSHHILNVLTSRILNPGSISKLKICASKLRFKNLKIQTSVIHTNSSLEVLKTANRMKQRRNKKITVSKDNVTLTQMVPKHAIGLQITPIPEDERINHHETINSKSI
ncbi:hypothetical protein MXB_1218, partial [Myxobolus squamalis]